MTYFLKESGSYFIIPGEAVDIQERLPVGNYVVRQRPMSKELYLDPVDGFKIPVKLYGDTTAKADRVLRTFRERTASTGILLAGEKGSGKTLLASMISRLAAEQDIPTILVNAPWDGDDFKKLIQCIDQPCVVIFDEFEKVYRDQKNQENILTLMDGVYSTRKLFVLTCNDVYGLNDNLLNRPGRIYYYLHYRGLDRQFIVDYCADNLKDQTKVDSVCVLSSLFSEFNFDMLKAVVEEMNRYGESAQDVIAMLNTKPSSANTSDFSVSVTIPGKKVSLYNGGRWNGNPLSTTKTVDIYFNVENIEVGNDGDEDGGSHRPTSVDDDEGHVRLSVANIVKVDTASGVFVFQQNNVTVTLTRVPGAMMDYRKIF